MPLSRRQLALLHVAKTKLGLSEEQYRLALVNLGAATSATELDREGFDAVMGFFERLGFAPLKAAGPDYGQRPGMASFAQLELIRALWAEWTGGEGTEAGLASWLRGTFKVDSPRFLTMAQARGAITALKSMKAKAKARAAG